MSIDWGSSDWGKPGQNVTIAADGSFVDDRHSESVDD